MLCEQAIQEKDPERFLRLIQEIKHSLRQAAFRTLRVKTLSCRRVPFEARPECEARPPDSKARIL